MDTDAGREPSWRKYANDATAAVRGRFDECRQFISEAAEDYWERLRDFKENHPEGYDECERPMKLQDPLTEAGAWTLLAAVYDLYAEDAGTLAMVWPESDKSDRKTGVFFELLKDQLKSEEWPDDWHGPRGPKWSYDALIEDALRLVTPKGRGRKKRDYETIQHEKQISGDWNRARDAGTPKVDFAKEHGMTTKELDKLLGRVRIAKKRSVQ
jgi:hypothetical protein